MIGTIKNLCQITDNSSNMHFLVVDFNVPSLSLKAVSSVDIPLLKPYRFMTSI